MPAKKMTANDVMSKRLRSIRTNNDITQAKIAKRLNMAQTAVSRWERQFGTMNAEQIVTYCRIIGANPEEIFAEYCRERSVKK
ncbi:helix-turn-helix domain-containing protein [Ruminococcus sp.]|uniref:helix-turn-helix domain-containing protein n=1 Tax=Ruminococcus sp. TaxID=41978 RepID=UPI003AB295E6